jgi:hypothetical protein
VKNSFNFFITKMHTSDGQVIGSVTRKLCYIGPSVNTSDMHVCSARHCLIARH